MRSIFLVIFTCILSPIFSSWDDYFPNSELTYKNVNVISGHLNLTFTDLIVYAAKPLAFTRSYSSHGFDYGSQNQDLYKLALRGGWTIGGGWTIYPHTDMSVKLITDTEIEVFLPEPSGNLVCYRVNKKLPKHRFLLKPDTKTTGPLNTSGELSARSDPRNNQIEIDLRSLEAIVYLPNGGKRFYRGKRSFSPDKNPQLQSYFFLEYEETPSKHRTVYEYHNSKKHQLKRVYTTDPSGKKVYASIELDPPADDTHNFAVKTNGNRVVDYKFTKRKGRSYLNKVSTSFSSPEIFSPTRSRKGKGLRVHQIWADNSQELQVDYFAPTSVETEKRLIKHPDELAFYMDKVATLRSPSSEDNSLEPIANFKYEKGITEIRNSLNRKTNYHYNSKNGQINKIQFFDHNDKPYSAEKFFWKNDRLACKSLIDENSGATILARIFTYDSLGNVLEEGICGNLTGKQTIEIQLDNEGNLRKGEIYCKRNTYLPHFNVPIRQEEDNGLVKLFTYKPDTDLLESRLICDHELILNREFFAYNNDNFLVEEIADDGNTTDPHNLSSVTKRIRKEYVLDPLTSLPTEILESYWDQTKKTYVLLGKKRYVYSATNQIISEEIFDAEGKSRYTLETDYDNAGRVVRKKNVLGNESSYKFDSRGRLISVKEADSPLIKNIYYDGASRQSHVEEIDPKNNRRASGVFYNTEGQATKTIDLFGNSTTFSLDIFGRALETRFPEASDENGKTYIPIVNSAYNLQGDLISVSDAKGRITRTNYNTYRKPTCVISPDGSELKHEYNLCGTLAKTIHCDDTEERYTYNVLQKQTSKQIYSSNSILLSEESWNYKGETLLSHIDSNGNTTTYFYDGAGRKIAEKCNEREIRYNYDPLGFISEIIDGATGVKQIFLRDLAGKVLEQWEEQPNEKRENHLYYIYDQYQRKTGITQIQNDRQQATDSVWYDDQNRVIKHTNPLGETTHVEYNENFQNDLYQYVLQKTTTDALGHLISEIFDSLGHLVLIEKKDPFSSQVSKEEYFYDRAGDKVKAITTVFLKDKQLRQITSTYAYDSRKRLIQSIEAGKRTRSYQFDEKGRLILLRKPDNTTISYAYDDLDRLTKLYSSDKSVDLAFSYDKSTQPTEIKDLINKTSTYRTYDSMGNLLTDGDLHYQYDNVGRRTKLFLPDGSSISFSYSGAHLTQVTRYNANNPEPLYSHTYQSFNSVGQVERERRICNLGSAQTEHDLLNRPIQQLSSQLEIKVSYDEIGRLTSSYDNFQGKNYYSYDGLSQLIEEKNQTYAFDSIGNPATSDYEVNDLNELLHTPDYELIYDQNGNPLLKTDKNGQITEYQFDALDRLTKITQSTKIIEYQYDGLSRLIKKQSYILTNNAWQAEQLIYYLNDDQVEIGTIDSSGKILQLKVLGLGIQGDVGATVAIEVNGVPFAPLHDFRGNIIALLSAQNEVIESYDFTAFGKEKSTNFLNPWRFSSKRSDEGLIYFGKRFYDPSLQRWLSPDPAGFIDGPNLYAYVWNNPTNRLDELGLFSEDIWPYGNTEVMWTEGGSLLKLNNDWIPFHPDIYVGQKVSIECTLIGNDKVVFQFSPESMSGFVENLKTMFAKTDWQATLQGKEQSPIVVFCIIINGIRVEKEELFCAANILHEEFEGNCPVLGFYNRTRGGVKDLDRLSIEMEGIDTVSIVGLRQVLTEAMEYFSSVCPNFIISLTAHSEGGLILNNAISKMAPAHKAMAIKHLHIRTYGSVTEIPENFGLDVLNIVSIKDSPAKYAKKLFSGHKQNCSNVNFVPCLSSWKQKTAYVADHNFMGPTYQKALKDNINDLNGRYEFVYSKNR